MTCRKLLGITFGILSIAGLVGCAPASSEQGSNQPASTQAGGAAQTISYSAADQAAYRGAQQLKDASFCDKITDVRYKTACKTAISDGSKLQEAVTKMQTSICDTLSTKDQQDACKIEVEIQVKSADKQKEQNAQVEADQKLEGEIVASQDYTRCKELQSDAARSDCEMNILSNKALQTKDVSWCSKASTTDIQDLCKSTYKNLTASS